MKETKALASDVIWSGYSWSTIARESRASNKGHADTLIAPRGAAKCGECQVVHNSGRAFATIKNSTTKRIAVRTAPPRQHGLPQQSGLQPMSNRRPHLSPPRIRPTESNRFHLWRTSPPSASQQASKAVALRVPRKEPPPTVISM